VSAPLRNGIARQAAKIRHWYLIHKWTSLICTAFLLLLCITGLPLIFHEEIDHALGDAPEPPAMAANTPFVNLDRVVAAGVAQYPGTVPQYLIFDHEEPRIAYVTVGETAAATDNHYSMIDRRTARVLHAPDDGNNVMDIIFRLHVDMFAGLPGELFLGLMGLLFVTALVSGVMVYTPFMRRLDFGTVRKNRNTRVKWLDLHNMLGIVTLCWAFVVGGTGVLNTLGVPILNLWQADQLAQMVAPYKDKPAPAKFASIQAAMNTAERAAPDMTPSFLAFPGTVYSSKHHYAVFMEGRTPLTSRLYKPALIDAETGHLTAMREMPWYAKALFISQPLHFGDYGGLAMKIIWAILDIITIIVLASGVYLWLGKRRSALEQRLTELIGGAGSETAATVQA